MTSSWRSLAGAAVHLDRDRIELGGAIRCTVGVVIPLVIGLATGAVSEGVAAAVGALCAGFASFQGAYRSRVALTVAVAAGMAVSTVVGAVASHHGVSAVAVTAVWGAMAGLLGCLGQGALVTGMQWVVAELIVAVIPMTFSQALLRAAAVLAGGVLQTLLVVVVWPFGTSVVERRALQAAYSDLAAFAEDVVGGGGLGPSAASLSDARSSLGDPQPFSNASRLLAFQALVDEAERIRIEIAALARHRWRLSSRSRPVLDELIGNAAVVLRCIARGVGRDEEPRLPSESMASLSPDRKRLQAALVAQREPPWLVRQVVQACEAVGGQLRSAVRLAAFSAGRSDPRLAGRELPLRRHVAVRDSIETLRSNLSWKSTSFRHAVRLAVTLALATALYRASGLPHGYWIPLTALVVLRPDYASTAMRGASRVVGTIIGAGLATLVTALIRPDLVGLAVLFAVASFAAFVILRANYALFSVAVTSYVVFLLAFVKLPAMTAVSDRLLDTLIGGALAIIVYLVLPTWESRLIGPQLATLLGAQADYLSGVLAVWSDPTADRNRLTDLRAVTRLARSNSEASLDRLLAEPSRSLRSGVIDADQARGIVAAGGSISLAILSLHAQLPPVEAEPYPEAEPLRSALEAQARAEAEALRLLGADSGANGTGSRQDRGIPTALEGPDRDGAADSDAAATAGEPEPALASLRDLHTHMTDRLGARIAGMDDQAALLVEETDLVVDSLNTIGRLLHRRRTGVL